MLNDYWCPTGLYIQCLFFEIGFNDRLKNEVYGNSLRPVLIIVVTPLSELPAVKSVLARTRVFSPVPAF
jgi:hypothetical protein